MIPQNWRLSATRFRIPATKGYARSGSTCRNAGQQWRRQFRWRGDRSRSQYHVCCFREFLELKSPAPTDLSEAHYTSGFDFTITSSRASSPRALSFHIMVLHRSTAFLILQKRLGQTNICLFVAALRSPAGQLMAPTHAPLSAGAR